MVSHSRAALQQRMDSVRSMKPSLNQRTLKNLPSSNPIRLF